MDHDLCDTAERLSKDAALDAGFVFVEKRRVEIDNLADEIASSLQTPNRRRSLKENSEGRHVREKRKEARIDAQGSTAVQHHGRADDELHGAADYFSDPRYRKARPTVSPKSFTAYASKATVRRPEAQTVISPDPPLGSVRKPSRESLNPPRQDVAGNIYNHPLAAQSTGQKNARTYNTYSTGTQNEHSGHHGGSAPPEGVVSLLPLDDEQFRWNILVPDKHDNYINAVALLDTQCQKGNWISQSLVKRLGRSNEISQGFCPCVADANGHPVVAYGSMDLQWKRSRGNRFFQCACFIFPASSNHVDLLIGVEFITAENLLNVNKDALLPLLLHKSLDRDSKAAIAIAKEEQRQQKLALEAKHAANRQSQGDPRLQTTQGNPQSQSSQSA